MRYLRRAMLMALACFGLMIACNEDAQKTAKPESEIDQGLVDSGKADFVSNYLTTIKGNIAFGQGIEAAIDYPEWYHGYTVELIAGAKVSVEVTTDELSIVAFYGPSTKTVNGQPQFQKALKKVTTKWDGDVYTASFQVKATKTGQYMVVYGPKYVWEATYSVELDCVEGCRREGECFSDEECAENEYCGDNGVRCIKAPCTPQYNICKPKEIMGGYCDRDRMCQEGMTCIENACASSQPKCQTDADCDNGYCWYADGTCSDNRVCKPWAQEGEHCQGHVPCYLVRICEPEFSCVAHPTIVDGPGVCRVYKTVAELMANPAEYNGKRVLVDGYISMSPAMCTKRGCTVQNPCCNSCFARQLLNDALPGENTLGGLTLEKDGSQMGCGGNECNYQDNCPMADGKYRVLGTFVQGEYETKIVIESTLILP